MVERIVNLTEWEIESLGRIAEAYGISFDELLRRVCDNYIESYVKSKNEMYESQKRQIEGVFKDTELLQKVSKMVDEALTT